MTSGFKNIQKNYPFFIALAVLLILTVYRIILNDVWIDESASLLTSKEGLARGFKLAILWEEQAPLYYVFLSAWRLISLNYIFARYLSLLLVVITLWLFYLEIKKNESRKNIQVLLLLYISTNYMIIFSSIYIRYYALVILLSMLMLRFYQSVYLTDKNSNYINRFLFTFLTTVAVFTQYYMGILALAIGVNVLLRKGFKRFVSYGLDMLIPVGLLILGYTFLSEQISTYSGYGNEELNLLELPKYLLVQFENYFFFFEQFFDIKVIRYAVRALIFGVVAYGLINAYRLKKETNSLIAILVVIFASLSVLFIILDVEFIKYWHTLFLFVVLMMLFIYLIIKLPHTIKAVILGTFILINLISLIGFNHIRTDAQELVHVLHANEKANQPVIIYPIEQEHILSNHYKGINQLVPIPFKINIEKGYNMQNWAFTDEQQLDSALSIYITNEIEQFYYVRDTTLVNGYNVDFKVPEFTSYLDKRYALLSADTIGSYILSVYQN